VADLMLLKVDNPDVGWKPLKEADLADTAEFNEALFAYGHYKESGLISRSMRRGYLETSTLEALIPQSELEAIRRAGIPATDLEIIYLDAGSLLPGCSGAPIINAFGKLVGIGDGGIEQGAITISWGIPAVNLLPLEQTGETVLPSGFSNAVAHFSADSYEDGSQPEQSSSIVFGPYRFARIKTRPLRTLIKGSDSPVTLQEVILPPSAGSGFLNREYIVYEDATKGIVLVIPAEARLESSGGRLNAVYRNKSNLYYTRSTVDPNVFNDPFYLYTHEKAYLEKLNRRYPNAGYRRNHIESMDYGREKRMTRVLYEGHGAFSNRYVTFLFNKREVFQAEAEFPGSSHALLELETAAHLTCFADVYSQRGVIPAATELVAHYPLRRHPRDLGPKKQGNVDVKKARFANNALYFGPDMQAGKGALTPRLEGFDLDSYIVEAQFKVTAYRDNPVLLIGKGWRVLGIELTQNRKIILFSQHPISYTATNQSARYKLNRWHHLKLEYKRPYFTLYLDNRRISRGKCLTDQRAKDAGENKVLFYNSANARNFSGFIRELKVYGPPKVIKAVPTLKYLKPYIHLKPRLSPPTNIRLEN
jgi:hypothetical protein